MELQVRLSAFLLQLMHIAVYHYPAEPVQQFCWFISCLAYKRNVGQPYLTYNSLLYFNLTFLNCHGCPIFLYNSFREWFLSCNCCLQFGDKIETWFPAFFSLCTQTALTCSTSSLFYGFKRHDDFIGLIWIILKQTLTFILFFYLFNLIQTCYSAKVVWLLVKIW